MNLVYDFEDPRDERADKIRNATDYRDSERAILAFRLAGQNAPRGEGSDTGGAPDETSICGTRLSRVSSEWVRCAAPLTTYDGSSAVIRRCYVFARCRVYIHRAQVNTGGFPRLPPEILRSAPNETVLAVR